MTKSETDGRFTGEQWTDYGTGVGGPVVTRFLVRNGQLTAGICETMAIRVSVGQIILSLY